MSAGLRSVKRSFFGGFGVRLGTVLAHIASLKRLGPTAFQIRDRCPVGFSGTLCSERSTNAPLTMQIETPVNLSTG